MKDSRELKDLIKKVRALIAEKKMSEAKEMMSSVYKVLDKSVKTGLLKKNTASRTKSRITKAVNS